MTYSPGFLSTIYEGGADYVERGWVQRAYETKEGVCAWGGLARAAGVHPLYLPSVIWRPFAKFLGVDCIQDWNDDKGRTQQQVLDAMRSFAKDCRIEAERAS